MTFYKQICCIFLESVGTERSYNLKSSIYFFSLSAFELLEFSTTLFHRMLIRFLQNDFTLSSENDLCKEFQFYFAFVLYHLGPIIFSRKKHKKLFRSLFWSQCKAVFCWISMESCCYVLFIC